MSPLLCSVAHLAQRGCHLVGQCACHDHGVRLAGAGTEDDAKPAGAQTINVALGVSSQYCTEVEEVQC
jgi:hypothetical protein